MKDCPCLGLTALPVPSTPDLGHRLRRGTLPGLHLVLAVLHPVCARLCAGHGLKGLLRRCRRMSRASECGGVEGRPSHRRRHRLLGLLGHELIVLSPMPLYLYEPHMLRACSHRTLGGGVAAPPSVRHSSSNGPCINRTQQLPASPPSLASQHGGTLCYLRQAQRQIHNCSAVAVHLDPSFACLSAG